MMDFLSWCTQACFTESQFYQDLQVGFIKKFLNSATKWKGNQNYQKWQLDVEMCVYSFDNSDWPR